MNINGASIYAVGTNSSSWPYKLSTSSTTSTAPSTITGLSPVTALAIYGGDIYPQSIAVPSEQDLAALAAIVNRDKSVTILGGAGLKGAHGELLAVTGKLRSPIAHALRNTFISNLAAAGVHPKSAGFRKTSIFQSEDSSIGVVLVDLLANAIDLTPLANLGIPSPEAVWQRSEDSSPIVAPIPQPRTGHLHQIRAKEPYGSLAKISGVIVEPASGAGPARQPASLRDALSG